MTTHTIPQHVADYEARIRAAIAAAEARGERYDVTAPDAPITTTPEDAPLTQAADTDAPTAGGTTEPQKAQVTRELVRRWRANRLAERIVQNSYQRNLAAYFEPPFYAMAAGGGR